MRSLQSDWEASSEEEKPTAPAPLAPAKKKGSLKQKLAEKEAARQARLAAGDDEDEVEYDEDAVLDPRAKARLEKERELESDLHNATELFGSATVKGVCVCARARSCHSRRARVISHRLTQTPSLALSHRLVRRRPRHDPEIDAQIQGGLYRALGRHHRARHQTASGQAAVRRFCGAPRARPCRAAARCRCAQGGERTHDARE